MFLTNIKLAIRNVFRNKRRTLITLCSIIFGGIALILVGGYIEYSFWGLREITIRSELGHIQIYRKGFTQKGNIDPQKYLLSPQEVRFIENKLGANSQIRQYARRLSVAGIISDGKNSLFFLGQGIEPEKENEISSSMTITEGADLMDEDKYKILVGKELAKQLNLKTGDSVTLLVTTLSGSINAIDFEIAGIISNGVKAFEEKIIRMKLNDCQELLGTNSIERIVLLLNNTENTHEIANLLQQEFKNKDFELKTWEELADYYNQVRIIYQNIFSFLKTIILVVIVLSIVNTMTMSVMERTSEIGTLRAMGTSRKEVLFMMINEGLVIGILGGIGAIFFGSLLAFIINLNGGIYMPPPPGHTNGYMILIKIVPEVLIFTFLLSILASIVSSLFPAIKAARLNVVEALRHV